MCNNRCNQTEIIVTNNHCGCSETPCQEVNCACDVFLSSDCINNVKSNFECLGIATGLTLTETLEEIDQAVCDKIATITNYQTLINTGLGAEIYSGMNNLGHKKIRKINNNGGNLIDVTQNTDDISITVDEEELTSFIHTVNSDINIVNIGVGAEVFKQKTINDFEFRKIKKTDVGSGISTINSVTTNTDEVSINARTIVSSNGTLSIDVGVNGEIDINVPTDLTTTSFYVNQNFTGISTGSIVKPYKKLTDALVAMVGTGTLASPQYYGAKIILQTDIVVEQIDLDTNPILENKLSVNSMTITSSNGKSNIYFRGTANYPIDTEFLITKVGFDGSLKLNLNVFINLNNIGLHVENSFGILKHRNYFNGTLYEVQNNSAITLENVDMECNYTPQGSYTNALDSNGNPILFYGNTVKVQDSIPNNTPHVYVYGRNSVNEGSFIIKDISISGTSQTIFKAYDTTISIVTGKVVCSRNVFYVNTDNIVTNGIYLPKNDLYLIELDNVSYCRIDNISELNQFPYNTVDNVQLGGDNAFIKLNNSNFITENYYNYGSHQLNYFLEMDELSNFSTTNSRFENIPILIEAFHPIGTFSTVRPIGFENSKINKVLSNYFKLVAIDSIVNGYKYSSNISFANDSSALLAGLVIGNIYYNTTINAMKRIV